jgi:hypothetical protein
MSCIYRAQTALGAYQQASAVTAQFLDEAIPGAPRIALYFRALALWEMCLLNWQILVEVYNELSSDKAFTKGDRSRDERAYEIANSIKHAGAIPAVADPTTVPMWLTNEGLRSSRVTLEYSELAQLLDEAVSYARSLIDPKSALGR